ncbi:MAG: methionine adenosyltransferase, partial [Nitrososphaerales archaeon]
MSARSLHVESLGDKAISDLNVEIIERKGQGHPDSLIDGASEAVSKALCDFYLKEFGSILHHNVDKGLLVGGKSEARFGGGEVLEPIQIMVAGRATSSVKRNGELSEVPVGGLAVSSIKNFLNKTMRFLDTETHVITDFKIKPGSTDLVGVYGGNGGLPLSNDTSIGVGYSPLTPAEKLVLETERLLNSAEIKHEMPELGEDIKVMALRNGSTIDLTIAA